MKPFADRFHCARPTMSRRWARRQPRFFYFCIFSNKAKANKYRDGAWSETVALARARQPANREMNRTIFPASSFTNTRSCLSQNSCWSRAGNCFAYFMTTSKLPRKTRLAQKKVQERERERERERTLMRRATTKKTVKQQVKNVKKE